MDTWTSYSRTSSLRRVDFPEPLGPTTAQLCPGSTFRLTPFSTGLPGWYLRCSRGPEIPVRHHFPSVHTTCKDTVLDQHW